MAGFKFKFSVKPGFAQRLEKLVEEIVEGTKSAFKSFAGDDGEAVFNNQLPSKMTKYSSGNQALLRQLRREYEIAWRRRYNKISSEFQNSRRWRNFKIKHASLGDHPRRKYYGEPNLDKYPEAIRYVAPGLMTGFLRETVADAFRGGGNEFLKMGNLLVRGEFDLQEQNYPTGYKSTRSYVSLFIEFLNNNFPGVLDGENFVNFSEEDWQRLAVLTKQLVEQGLLGSMEEFIAGWGFEL